MGGLCISPETVERLRPEAADKGISLSKAVRGSLEREARFAQALVEDPELQSRYERWLKSRKDGRLPSASLMLER
jgi:hypothetical protein